MHPDTVEVAAVRLSPRTLHLYSREHASVELAGKAEKAITEDRHKPRVLRLQ